MSPNTIEMGFELAIAAKRDPTEGREPVQTAVARQRR